jgi:5'-deoxynucleotidase YfbR-like HD superfamily hydrolase
MRQPAEFGPRSKCVAARVFDVAFVFARLCDRLRVFHTVKCRAVKAKLLHDAPEERDVFAAFCRHLRVEFDGSVGKT